MSRDVVIVPSKPIEPNGSLVLDCDETAFFQIRYQGFDIVFQLRLTNGVFRKQGIDDLFEGRVAFDQMPDPKSHRVETEIAVLCQVQKYRSVIDFTNQDAVACRVTARPLHFNTPPTLLLAVSVYSLIVVHGVFASERGRSLRRGRRQADQNRPHSPDRT